MIRPVDYKQTDPRWAAVDYSAPGEKTDIRESGCGPTAAAMVAATWGHPEENPATAAAWALEHGYKAPHQGTYYAFFEPYLARFGIKCRQLNWQRIDRAGQGYGGPYHEKVLTALAEGALVIACMGPGLWTKGGHFVVLYGVTGGMAMVADPASSNPVRTMGDWGRFRREVKYYFVCRRPEGGGQEDEDMTQEQFNAMMDKYLEERAGLPGSEWARDAHRWAAETGMVKGDGRGSMQWQGFLTRESAAVLLRRLYDMTAGR